MTTTTATCPTCSGLRMVGHPAGFAWDHTATCSLRVLDDGTVAADHDRAQYVPTTRPPTTAERVLLAACGVTLAPGARTTVQALTSSIVRRSWQGVDLDAA